MKTDADSAAGESERDQHRPSIATVLVENLPIVVSGFAISSAIRLKALYT